MKEPQNIQWKRIAVEAAAIVGSILLAFWIDASWQNRQDVEQGRRLADALVAEGISLRQATFIREIAALEQVLHLLIERHLRRVKLLCHLFILPQSEAVYDNPVPCRLLDALFSFPV